MPLWKKIIKVLKEWLQIIITAIILAVLINLFIFQPVRIEGESMMPTLHNNDYVILSKLGRTFGRDLKYGDIVVIDRSQNKSNFLLDDIQNLIILKGLKKKNLIIKRIIGLPGDSIEIRDGAVIRNGTPVEEPYILDKMQDKGADLQDSYLVPENYVFVLGDNRNNSMDSRIIGYIPIDRIKGTMVLDISKLLRQASAKGTGSGK